MKIYNWLLIHFNGVNMNEKLIKRLPLALLQDIVANRSLPIIGAGFSKNVNSHQNKDILTWDELGKKISEEIVDYSYYNPLEALSTYAHEYTRVKLIERAKELLNINNIIPGETHHAFSEIPFDIICTTNYDFLLEDSYKNNSRIVKTISEESHLSICANDENTVLIKIHGDFNHPTSMVITEEDYDSFINNNPMLSTYITNLLITRTPIFIGYSIEDYNFRMIWQIVKDRLGGLHRPAYVIKVNANMNEISRYKRRGVQVVNLPGETENYPAILKKLFFELKDYWNDETLNRSMTTKEEVNIQLNKPKKTNTNLCFLSSPFKNASIYKKYFSPILRKYGIVLTSADEVINVGDNIVAKIMAIIKKANYFIVENYDSEFSTYELNSILKKERINKNNIFIIGNKTNKWDDFNISYNLQGEDPVELIEEIALNVDSWAKNLKKEENLVKDEKSEAERLFEQKEYRPAFISAFSDIEFKLRNYVMDYPKSEIRLPQGKYYSLRNMFEIAIENKLLRPENMKLLNVLINVRNLAIHEKKDVSKEDAEMIININKEISDSIQKYNIK